MTGDAEPVDNTRPAITTDLTRTQHVILEVWTAVLEVEGLALTDDFFDVGGNSVTAARITSRLRSLFEAPRLPLVLIFEHPTIAELADAIDEILREPS